MKIVSFQNPSSDYNFIVYIGIVDSFKQDAMVLDSLVKRSRVSRVTADL